jgi:hypothetical protein
MDAVTTSKSLFRNVAWGGTALPAAHTRSWPKKGRPPPGGEEAEVVVYQPRGVGLIHTRHKPSDVHYTRGDANERNPSFDIEISP